VLDRIAVGEGRAFQSELDVEAGAGQVGIGDEDLPTKLGEVDAEVDGQQALADATAAAADRDDMSDTLGEVRRFCPIAVWLGSTFTHPPG